MVTIVIDQHDRACAGADVPKPLESTIDAAKILERGDDRLVWDLQLGGDRYSRQRIAHVVQPGEAQIYR